MKTLTERVGRDPDDDGLWWTYQSLASHQPEAAGAAGVTYDDFVDLYQTEWKQFIVADLRALAIDYHTL